MDETAPAKKGERLSRAQRKALEWFAANGEVSIFRQGDPSLTLVKRLRDAGLLVSKAPRAFGLTAFSLSPAGREALTHGK